MDKGHLNIPKNIFDLPMGFNKLSWQSRRTLCPLYRHRQVTVNDNHVLKVELEISQCFLDCDSFASMESLFLTVSEKKARTTPCESWRKLPTPIEPSLSLVAPSTLNFTKSPLGSLHFCTIFTFFWTSSKSYSNPYQYPHVSYQWNPFWSSVPHPTDMSESLPIKIFFARRFPTFKYPTTTFLPNQPQYWWGIIHHKILPCPLEGL